MSITKVFIAFIIFLAVIAGAIALQIFLSKKQSKWLGLVIPLVCIIFSIIAVLGVATYSTSSLTEQYISESGEIVNNVINSTSNRSDTPSIIITVISIFLLYNIPTVFFLAIYFACREKLRRCKEIEKMNIQDLE